MSLIDDIRIEQEKGGTSLDPKYVRRMEAALLDADKQLERICMNLAGPDQPDIIKLHAIALKALTDLRGAA